MLRVLVAALACAGVALAEYRSEIVQLPGHLVKEDYRLPLPHTYTTPEDLPTEWNWADVNGTSFVTKNLNQHLPQYCGSCWAHGALSSLADRVKIARRAQGVDINLSVQYILNCGGHIAGSCHGGSHTGTYELVKKSGYVPFDTCLDYAACSKESNEGLCSYGDYTCSPINICRTCSTFAAIGGKCVEINKFPNVSIAEYGMTNNDAHAIKSEIFRRGPVAAEVNAEPLLNYKGGVFDDDRASRGVNHIVSITGWGVDSQGTEYWIVRNSWGEYWGEVGYFRIKTGSNQLGIEGGIAWATPATWTERNFPCAEDGSNCSGGSVATGRYVDPALKFARPGIAALTPFA